MLLFTGGLRLHRKTKTEWVHLINLDCRDGRSWSISYWRKITKCTATWEAWTIFRNSQLYQELTKDATWSWLGAYNPRSWGSIRCHAKGETHIILPINGCWRGQLVIASPPFRYSHTLIPSIASSLPLPSSLPFFFFLFPLLFGTPKR